MVAPSMFTKRDMLSEILLCIFDLRSLAWVDADMCLPSRIVILMNFELPRWTH